MFVRAALLGLTAVLAVACASVTPTKPAASQGPTQPDFVMRPSHLEKGHIYMRYTENWPEMAAHLKAQQKAAEQAAAPVAPTPPKVATTTMIRADGTPVQVPVANTEKDTGAVETVPPVVPAYKWIPLKEARVTMDADNLPLQRLVQSAVDKVTPYTGPWEVKWKLSRENESLLDERFSLNTDTSFGKFVSYVAGFVMNYRGIQLDFELYDKDRVLLISDGSKG